MVYVPIRLTSGYDPEALKDYPADRTVARDALIQTPSSYTRAATMTLDPDAGVWECRSRTRGRTGHLVSTPRGVMAVNVNWRTRLSDTGYQLTPAGHARDGCLRYLYDAAHKQWTRLGGGTSGPQNLYEMTSPAYDTKRQRLLLHGGGETGRAMGVRHRAGGGSTLRRQALAGRQPGGGVSPGRDRMLICGPAPEDRRTLRLVVRSGRNAWKREAVSFAQWTPQDAAGQNRAMVYDEKRDLVLLVFGDTQGKAAVYGMRYAR